MNKEFRCLGCEGIFPVKGSQYKNTYCSNRCQGIHKRNIWLKENTEKFEQGLLPSRAAIKKYIKIRDGEGCSICPQGPTHNGQPLTMILDHIDGDASNNHPLNFRLVCPNCDTQLPTYKSRNRGNGRATKGLKWYSSL